MNKLNFNLCSFRPRSSHYDNSYRLWRESNIRQRVFWRKREKSVRDWRRRKTSKLYTDTVSCVWERDKSETGGGGRQVCYVLILCHVYQRETSVRHWRRRKTSKLCTDTVSCVSERDISQTLEDYRYIYIGHDDVTLKCVFYWIRSDVSHKWLFTRRSN